MPMKDKQQDHFMMREFCRVEILNSIMCRLRGAYVVCAVMEKTLLTQDQEKIKRYCDRAGEITKVLHSIFWKSSKEQEEAITLFGEELKKMIKEATLRSEKLREKN